MNIQCILISFIVLPLILLGDIKNIEWLRDVKSYIDSNKTLVVFDIDNTLLQSESHLGSVAWGDYIAQDLEAKGISKKDAQVVASVFWRAVQPSIKVKAVDIETKQVIKDLQTQKTMVMCLTSRMPQELLYTLNQLQTIGVDIKITAPTQKSQKILASNCESFYTNGILFATPFNKKSEVFLSFLKKNNLYFKRIIFIDDKHSHVQDMEKAFCNEKTELVAIRFTKADKDIKTFNPNEAENQWKLFKRN